MAVAKRIFLFILTNILVITSISIVFAIISSFFDLGPMLTKSGYDLSTLAIFCLIWGFVGAFISLGLSRIMAKWAMKVQVIDPQTQNSGEKWVLDTVYRLAKQADLRKMPQVGIYHSEEVNAFATGPTKARSLVAVSTGLLSRMTKDEAEGVLAHEIAHIKNGDMVTLTLVQGVVNAFVMFIARLAAWAISQQVREESRPMVHLIAVIVLQIALSFLGMVVVAYFSRIREYRADIGGAKLAGREKMIAALSRLQSMHGLEDDGRAPQLAAFKINGKRGKLAAFFSTHPPLEDRIMRLQRSIGF